MILLLTAAAAFLYFYKRQQSERRELEAKRIEGIQVFEQGLEVSALCMIDGKLYVGGRDGLLILDGETGERLGTAGEDLQMIYAAGIVQTEDQTIWVGHNAGLTAFFPDGTRQDFAEPDIPSGRVNCLQAVTDMPQAGAVSGGAASETGQEALWVGTMSGAAKLESLQGKWQVTQIINRESGLASDTVNCILQQGNELWFGAYLDAQPGGISIWKADGTWQYISTEEGLCHTYVNAFLPAAEDQLLVGLGQLTYGGLQLLKRKETDGTWEVKDTWTTEDGLPGEKVRFLFCDSDNRLWITTESDGMLLLREGLNGQHPLDGVYLTEESGLSDNEIKYIVETQKGYWLGGRTGLTYIDKSILTAYLEEN